MGFIQFTHGVFLLLITAGANGSNAFKKCYNTSIETHCFEVQYNDTNNQLLTPSVDDARRRCSQRGATLVVIKNEEVNQLFHQFKSESGNPIGGYYVWTDALRIDDYNNVHTWHWINKMLPNIRESDVPYNLFAYDATYYVAVLELRGSNENWKYYLTARRPEDFKNYTCEFDESKCSSVVRNAKISDGRCYIAYSENVTWFEARNRCLMGGGDLASFKNVTNFNFTSLLDFTPQDTPLRAYWIGLRFTWYIWNGSGTEIGYLKWMLNYDQWSTARCLIVYFDCSNGCVLTPHTCDNTRDVYAVCHTITPLPTTTTGASTIHYVTKSTLTDNITSGNTVKLLDSYPVNKTSAQSSVVPLAVGIGVGVGVPVIVAIIVIVICVARRRRHSSQNSRSRGIEPNVSSQTGSQQQDGNTETHYQRLNQDKIELPTYEGLRVPTEPQYEAL